MGGSDYGILRQEHALQHLWVIHQAYGHLTGIQLILVCLSSHYLNVLFNNVLDVLVSSSMDGSFMIWDLRHKQLKVQRDSKYHTNKTLE